MIIGGVLLAANRRVAGGLLILLSFMFLLLTQDNHMLIEHIKPKPKIASIRMDDLGRHISFIGAILLLQKFEIVLVVLVESLTMGFMSTTRRFVH